MNHFLGNCDRQRLLISLANVFLQCFFNSMLYYSGLLELNFDLNYNTPSLNQWTVYTLQLSGIWEPPSAPAATMAVKTTGICIDYKEIYLYNYKLRDTDYQLSGISSSFCLSKPGINNMKNSFNYDGAKLWNSLPKHIRESKSISSFRNKIGADIYD